MTACDALDALRTLLGPRGYLDRPEDMAPYLRECRGRKSGTSPLVIRPADTAQVSAAVRICAEAGIPIVPQGGNTSLVGGSVPDHGTEVVLSLSRMDRIRAVDPLDYVITVEAGCILKRVQDAAAEVDRLFPLSLGAEGTCQIGGNLSTNAGGILTIRYGNARDLVLGLEVVLPDGRVWDGLRSLRKDNTGYDLKHLFIGAEGTLGVITAATLRLFPRPKQVETALVAVPDPEAAIALLARLRAATGDGLTAFELMKGALLDLALAYVPGTVDPLPDRHPWYVLLEAASGFGGSALRDALEETLTDAMEDGSVRDAVLSASGAQTKELWFIREAIVEAQRQGGGSIKHDVSVPVSKVAEFIERASAALETLIPGILPLPFGHVADGNIHFNVCQPAGADTAAFLERWDEVNRVVHDVVLSLGGSISAEHGIGTFKRGELLRVAGAVEVDLMRRVKAAIDPGGTMNPGKILD
ncbi:FAD-binding oxidoreductase [Arenibaculum sp.]|jgi:FAD/FMN-containing dehydrogenase|uniref:FAD-binding oxidoreductase n=1 Tax=Arenibaculum sp. TaxID=2865862 RepID=UPI002E1305CA|nr:FAD-binding oxidoreductase [Arenibaculum sp.]